ncbi:hypothetical protein MKW92_021761, partial [Papaver armeniacum]
KGVNMKGFFVWALLDCMEMGSAYNVRFGLYYTDYKNDCKRYPKKSAKWLRSYLKTDRLPQEQSNEADTIEMEWDELICE